MSQFAGEPLVLVPGMNCSATLWGPLAAESIAIPRLTETTLDAQVERLLDELPSRFTLVGLSLGAVVAMALTAVAPERVAGLGLLATNPYAPTPVQRQTWREQRDLLAGGASARELQHAMLPLLLRPETIRTRPEMVELALSMAGEVGEEALDAQLQLQADRADLRPGLAAIRCPTLVMAGRHDLMCSVARHREIADLAPGAQLTVVEDAAHLVPLERPADIAAAVRNLAAAGQLVGPSTSSGERVLSPFVVS